MKRKMSRGKKSTPREDFEDDTNAASDDGARNGNDSPGNAGESKTKKRRSAGKINNGNNDEGAKKNRRKLGRDSKTKTYQEIEDPSDDEENESMDQENSSPKRKSGRDSKTINYDSTDENEGEEVEKQKNASPKKKSAKESKTRTSKALDANEENGNSDKQPDDASDEEEFEVDKIIDHKKIRGQVQYLIRWKGYGPEGDTWEPEATLNCPDALNEYKKKTSGAKHAKKKTKPDETPEEWDKNENFEVVRILDVYFRKDGKREFLVAWKGYPNSANSWEPEENMDCKDMIQKYLKKCSQAREAPQKELRVNRKITDRFTLTTKEFGRRLSKRNQGKQRIHYHEAE